MCSNKSKHTACLHLRRNALAELEPNISGVAPHFYPTNRRESERTDYSHCDENIRNATLVGHQLGSRVCARQTGYRSHCKLVETLKYVEHTLAFSVLLYRRSQWNATAIASVP